MMWTLNLVHHRTTSGLQQVSEFVACILQEARKNTQSFDTGAAGSFSGLTLHNFLSSIQPQISLRNTGITRTCLVTRECGNLMFQCSGVCSKPRGYQMRSETGLLCTYPGQVAVVTFSVLLHRPLFRHHASLNGRHAHDQRQHHGNDALEHHLLG